MCTYSITYVVSAWFAGIIELVCTVTQSIAPSAVANIVRMSCRPSYAVKWASLPLHIVFIHCHPPAWTFEDPRSEMDKIWYPPEGQLTKKRGFSFEATIRLQPKCNKTNPPSNKNTNYIQQTPATATNTTLNIWQETTNRYTFSISAENARTEPVVSFTKFASHLASFSTIFTTNTVNRTRTTINYPPITRLLLCGGL